MPSAGLVNVLYGSVAGLTTEGAQVWHQDSAGVRDDSEPGDQFGEDLATGDFDDDGFDDLAIGVQGEDLPDGAGGTIVSAGAVNLLYGTAEGLSAARNQLWHQNRRQNKINVKEVAEMNDGFGLALAAGDFNKDRFDDLAIGVPFEDVGTNPDAGAVNVLYGTVNGLKAKGNQLWHQDKKGIGEKVAEEDRFGSALTVGRFNKGGHRDLAIGVPNEDVGAISNAGAVNVPHGSGSGLTADGDRVWHQDKKGVLGTAQPNDDFGRSLP